MSGKVVGWAFDQRLGSPTTKLVLVKLADNANDEGICWPSVATQAGDTELSERSITREVKKLQGLQLIRVEERLTSRGQVSNLYYLNVPWIRSRKNAPPPATQSGGAVPNSRGAHATVSGDALTQSQGHIENLQEEPSLNLAPSAAPPVTGRVERLSRNISKPQFDAWFGDAEFIEGSPWKVLFPSNFKRNWVVNKFAPQLSRIFGEDVRIDVRAPGTIGTCALPSATHQIL